MKVARANALGTQILPRLLGTFNRINFPNVMVLLIIIWIQKNCLRFTYSSNLHVFYLVVSY